MFVYVFNWFIHYTGQDATEAFEDVGHSDEARALLPGMLVGEFEQDTVSNHATFFFYNSIVLHILFVFLFRVSS